jgi:hypothetical protein
MALRDDEVAPDVLEVSSRRTPFQVIAGPIFRYSLQDIEVDEHTELARRWWPQGQDVPVVVDPTIAFGAPVLVGPRVTTAILARCLTSALSNASRDLVFFRDLFALPAGLRLD